MRIRHKQRSMLAAKHVHSHAAKHAKHASQQADSRHVQRMMLHEWLRQPPARQSDNSSIQPFASSSPQQLTPATPCAAAGGHGCGGDARCGARGVPHPGPQVQRR